MLDGEIVNCLKNIGDRLLVVEKALGLTGQKTLFSDKDQFAKDRAMIRDSLAHSDAAHTLGLTGLTSIVDDVLTELTKLYHGTKFCEATSRGGCNTCQLSYERQIKFLRGGLTQIEGYTSSRSTAVHMLPDSIDTINAIATDTLEGADEGTKKQ